MIQAKKLAHALLVMTGTVASSYAQAGTVRAISKEKGQVAIDLTPAEKPGPKATVCIFTPAKKKIACGKAVKQKGTVLIIKIANPAVLTKITKGLDAQIQGAPPPPVPDDDSSDKAAPTTAAADSDTPPPTKTKGQKKPPLRIALGWDFAIALPATFNQLQYLPPTTQPASTVWQSTKKVSSGIFPPSYEGITGEVGIPVGKKALNLGFRYQVFQANLVTSDFNAGVTEPYVSTEVKSSAIGFWADYQFYRNSINQMIALALFSGLDYDSTTVNLTALDLDDGPPSTSAPLVTATGKLTLLSLRLGARADALLFGPVGVSFGLTAIIPLFAATNSFSANFGSVDNRGVANPQSDLKNALGLKKNSFGLEAIIGAFVAL